MCLGKFSERVLGSAALRRTEAYSGVLGRNSRPKRLDSMDRNIRTARYRVFTMTYFQTIQGPFTRRMVSDGVHCPKKALD